MKIPAYFIITACLLSFFATSADARTWTEKTTGRTIEGEYIKTEGKVVIIRRDGKMLVRIPLEKLSDADLDFVKERSTPGGGSKPSSTDPGPVPTTEIEKEELRKLIDDRSLESDSRLAVGNVVDADFVVFAIQKLRDRDFKSLDYLCKVLRDTKVRAPRCEGKYWQLHLVYEALSDLNRDADDDTWLKRDELLKEWQQELPQSPTAAVARGGLMVHFAWKARGYSVAKDVPDSAWPLFKERIAQAEKILDGDFPHTCPEWTSFRLWVVIAQGRDDRGADRVFEEGIKLHPEYFPIYYAMMNYLLPRWGGNEGEWQEMASSVAKQISPEMGARICVSADGYPQIDNRILPLMGNTFGDRRTLRKQEIDWDEIKKGYELIEQRYPDSDRCLNHFARMASLAGDRDTAVPLFQRIGDKFDEYVWKSEAAFKEARDWAMPDGGR